MRSAVQEMTHVRLAQYVMGTVVEITVSTESGEDHARQAAACALREFERIEKVFSRFDPDSELPRVNKQASSRNVRVSDEFFALTDRGLQYSRHSAGAFSITLQPLVSLWERAARQGETPCQNEICRAQFLCDPQAVILDRNHQAIRLSIPGMSLNFDGLAKGYATDRARAILQDRGLTNAMVNGGASSIAVLYPSTHKSPWSVAVRHPAAPEQFVALLSVEYPALSTSGTSERGFMIRDRWFSHVIDPFSGFPVEELASATVLGEYAEFLEVASKLLLLHGCEKGLRICDRLGWDVDGMTARSHSDGLAMQYPDDFPILTEPEYDAHSTCVY